MKKKGIEFEEYIARRLGGVEEWASTTINSGAVCGDEDAKSPRFIVQCKSSTMKGNFIIQEGDWDQLQTAALRERTPDGKYKSGLFAVRNRSGKVLVAMDIEDFLGLLEEINDLTLQVELLEDEVIHGE